jgi:hypothetical protein
MPLLDEIIRIIPLTIVPAYASVIIFDIIIKRRKREQMKEKFFTALLEGLKTNTVETLDDVVNIYMGIAGLSSEDLSYRFGLSKLLREFLVEVITKKLDEKIHYETLRSWKKKITEFIQKNEEISPYADLPAPERNLLSDIQLFLERNDIDSAKRKILELSAMIQARNDDLNRIRNINKWTVPLSIIGVILTIVFGILAWIK